MADQALTTRDRLDEAEALILALGGVTSQEDPDFFPMRHRFTPGLYIRELFIPAGSCLTTYIHKFEHPYVVMRGRCSVYSDADGPMEVRGPFMGITKAGTRRFVMAHEDTLWMTFHPTELTNVADIEAEIFEQAGNPLLLEEST